MEKHTPQRVRFVYYLAPRFGYAVLRWEQFTLQNQKQKECVSSVFEALPGRKVWLPKKAFVVGYEEETVDRLVYRETPWRTSDYAVSEFATTRYPESYFTLQTKDIEPGRRVHDDMNPDLKLPDGTTAVYIMPASPNDLDDAIARAVQTGQPPPHRNSLVRGVLADFTLLFIAVAVFRIVIKRRMAPGK